MARRPARAACPLPGPRQNLSPPRLYPPRHFLLAHFPLGLSPSGLCPPRRCPMGLSPRHLSPRHLSPQGLAPQGLAPQGLAPRGLCPPCPPCCRFLNRTDRSCCVPMRPPHPNWRGGVRATATISGKSAAALSLVNRDSATSRFRDGRQQYNVARGMPVGGTGGMDGTRWRRSPGRVAALRSLCISPIGPGQCSIVPRRAACGGSRRRPPPRRVRGPFRHHRHRCGGAMHRHSHHPSEQ